MNMASARVVAFIPVLSLLAAHPVLAQRPPVVRDVRVALNAHNFAAAEQAVERYKQSKGVDSAYLEALSWLGRAKLAARDYDAADRYAAQTRKLALDLLKTRKLDADASLPLALGASIEVQSQVLNARGQKSEAVAFLQQEIRSYGDTSIAARLNKNLNQITLVGQRPLPIEMKEWIGLKPPALASLQGRKVLLFFWAHWCGDCKQQAPVLAQLKREFGDKLTILAPTQPYGYVAGGEDAPRADEIKYIDEVRREFYSGLDGMTVPVSELNFKRWGVSTTPTLAVLDAKGIVRLYHPGKMTYAELLPYVRD